LALAIVLVFAVTRVILVPQGEFAAYGALTLAMLQAGRVPGTVYLLALLALLVAVLDAVEALRQGRGAGRTAVAFFKPLIWPAPLVLLSLWAAPRQMPLMLQSLLALA